MLILLQGDVLEIVHQKTQNCSTFCQYNGESTSRCIFLISLHDQNKLQFKIFRILQILLVFYKQPRQNCRLNMFLKTYFLPWSWTCLALTTWLSCAQRLSAVTLDRSMQGKDMDSNESVHFQRGSVDIVTFKGSKLGKIEAFWIGLESGSWRLDGVSLTVISGPVYLSPFTESGDESQFDCVQYKFEANNVLLGEGGISIVELRPFCSTELSRISFTTSLNMQSLSQTLLLNKQTTKEDSMREYADLKFSLLVYDLILISSGSSILNFSFNEKAAYAFVAGGIGGFLYLLLLQRSVDGLSAPGNQSENGENFLQASGGFKRQWLTLALVIALGSTVLKYRIGGTTIALSPTELFTGVAGFLTSKIAVVLAAFRPFERNSKNK
ncbi:unnamed protein product [Musa hybrid cultivar]